MSTTIRPRDPSEGAARPMRGRLTSPTRREFIRGIAAAGASTAGAVAMQGAGAHLFGEEALARGRRNSFAGFTAIAASSADALEVPAGFRADVLISWGDIFRGSGGPALRYGFNNDFLAYFPLKGSREGLLFVNHEYPDPFFLHGYKPTGAPKTPAQVQEEQDSVGNSILHIRRRRNGRWRGGVAFRLQPPHLRRPAGPRIHGAPHGRCGHRRRARTARWATARAASPRGEPPSPARRTSTATARTWRTTSTSAMAGISGAGSPRTRSTSSPSSRSTAGSASTIPTTPSTPVASTPPWGVSATRTRPSATSPDRGSCSTWVTTRRTRASTSSSQSAGSARVRGRTTGSILEEGTLYIARWEPEGRRRFAVAGDTDPISATEGTGRWVRGPRVCARGHGNQAARDLRRRVQRPFRDQPSRGSGGRRGRERLHLPHQQQHRQRFAWVGAAPTRAGQRPGGEAVPLARLCRGRPHGLR